MQRQMHKLRQIPKTPTNSSHAPASSTAAPNFPAKELSCKGRTPNGPTYRRVIDEKQTDPTQNTIPKRPPRLWGFWVELSSKNRFRIWGLFGETMDDHGKRAHGVCVPEGETLALVALLCTRCKHELVRRCPNLRGRCLSLGPRSAKGRCVTWGYAADAIPNTKERPWWDKCSAKGRECSFVPVKRPSDYSHAALVKTGPPRMQLWNPARAAVRFTLPNH